MVSINLGIAECRPEIRGLSYHSEAYKTGQGAQVCFELTRDTIYTNLGWFC